MFEVKLFHVLIYELYFFFFFLRFNCVSCQFDSLGSASEEKKGTVTCGQYSWEAPETQDTPGGQAGGRRMKGDLQRQGGESKHRRI